MIIRTKSASVLAVLVLFFSLFSSAPSYAAALAVTFPSSSHGFVEGAWSSVATSTGTTPAVTGDATGASIRLTITASNSADRLRLADVTSISAASGLTLTDFDTTGAGLAEIAIEGAVADVSASIATLEYNPGTGGSSTISVSVLDGVGSIFGGHYYEAVASGTVWKDAGGYTASNPRTAAALLTNGTCTGYLATITSAQENAIAQALVPAGQYSSWIGATDRGNTTNEWEWLDGPEAGTIFFKSSDATFNLGYYNNWGGVEPNDYQVGDGTRDDYVYILQDGTWADATYGSATSIVEYGDAGCTPNLSAASASFTAVLFQTPAPAPAPYSGPIPTNYSDRTPSIGDDVIISGLRMNLVTSCTIDGVTAVMSNQSADSFTIVIPIGISSGLKDLVMTGPAGKLTAQGALTIQESIPEIINEALVSSKLNAGSFNGYVAVFAKGHKGKTLAWKIAGKWFKTTITSDYQVFQRKTAAVGLDVDAHLYIDGQKQLTKTVRTR